MQALINQIIKDIIRTQIFWPSAMIVACMVFAIALVCKVKIKNCMILTILAFYLTVAGCRVFIRESGSTRLNLALFSTTRVTWRYYIENILLFIPLGILLPGLITQLRWEILIVGLVMSLGIESIQYISGVGKAELDDVMANILGTAIGYGLMRLIYNIGKQ